MERTLQLRCGAALCGSAFVFDRDGRQYIATAWHCIKDLYAGAPLEMREGQGWVDSEAAVLGIDRERDVAVLAVNKRLADPPSIVSLGSDGLSYSMQMFVLGFPYGLEMDPSILKGLRPLPFAKSGILAGMEMKREGVFYIDAALNEGFSGGPAIAMIGNAWKYIGLVSGAAKVREPVMERIGPALDDVVESETMYVEHDTGLSQIENAAVIERIVSANPKGFNL